MKLTPQEAYDHACNSYNRAKTLIRELSDLYQETVSDFSYDVAMRQFDIILQCILYREAIADSAIVHNEKVFLRDITEYADVIKLVNHIASTKFTWEDLLVFTPAQQQTFAQSLDKILDDTTTEFVVPFALVDAAVRKRNFIDELDEIIGEISLCFAAVDGDDVAARWGTNRRAVDRELEAAAKAHATYLSGKWNRAVSEFGKKK